MKTPTGQAAADVASCGKRCQRARAAYSWRARARCFAYRAIGIEALSRGAAHVTFVETDARALKLIAANLQTCGVSDRYAIIRALRPLAAGSIDLAVLDPPYDVPDLSAHIAAVEPLIAPGGLLVLEHARRRPAPERVGALTRTRNLISGTGDAFYHRGVSGRRNTMKSRVPGRSTRYQWPRRITRGNHLSTRSS